MARRIDNLSNLISAARGDKTVDLVLRNVKMINVFTAEIYQTNVAIDNGVIVGMGSAYRWQKEEDLKGLYLSPGFIDSHVHIESSMLTVPRFARAVVARGTTSVICDPHEIANVLGIDGLKFMIDSSQGVPLNVFFMLPSCVPATGLETSGATLSAQDLAPFINHPQVLGLAEMMNFPGVVNADKDVMEKLALGGHKRLDGHAPGLSGLALCAYVASGIASDHECTSIAEAKEKMRVGMYIMLREGTAAKNLSDLLPLVTLENERRCLLVTDDRHPNDILEEGHIDFLLRTAIAKGMPPLSAIRMATLNAAEYFRIERTGAIAPGYFADLVAFDSLENIQPRRVYKDGQLIAIDGQLTLPPLESQSIQAKRSVNLGTLSPADFLIQARSRHAHIIGLGKHQLYTEDFIGEPAIENDQVVSDTKQDLLKITVVERHKGTGRRGMGLVQGFGLQRGALAASVAHDSHNIIAIGADDESIYRAVSKVAEMQGGIAAVDGEKVEAALELSIAGLMSNEPIEKVSAGMNELKRASGRLGCRLEDPFMTMSFLALPVIPKLKITDKGLVDVTKFQLVDLFVAD
ncbi:MAG: adenine deaminase [Blastocatellia bacterium]|nr:adenine deaminase [Blastocatellia bacterium]